MPFAATSLSPHARRAITLKRLLIAVAAVGLLVMVAAMVYVAIVVNKPRGQPGKYAAQIEAIVLEGQIVTGPNGMDVIREIGELLEATERETLAKIGSETTPGGVDYITWLSSGPGILVRDENKTDANARSSREARACFTALMEGEVPALMDKLAGTTWALIPVLTDQMIFGQLPVEMGVARQIARLAAVRLHQAAVSGNAAGAVAALRCGLVVGRHSGNQYGQISGLTGISIDVRMYAELRDMVLAGSPEPTVVAALIAKLKAFPAPTMRKSIRTERLGVLDCVELNHTADGFGGGVLLRNFLGIYVHFDESSGSALAGLASPRKGVTRADANRVFDLMEAASNLPTVAEASVKRQQCDSLTYSIVATNKLLAQVLPSARSATTHFSIQAERNFTLCMLALELFERQTGSLPPTLEALTVARGDSPAILGAADILDPCSGKPLIYRLAGPADEQRATTPNGWPARPRRYVLYSVGGDGVDNGGVAPPREVGRSKVIDSIVPGYDVDFTVGY